ncbi:MAG: AAA family ATPase [Candidatus Bathyarchaeota archaeon]|nr:AAA family ATPase [Candidatus Bathyarchaeota archaeon]
MKDPEPRVVIIHGQIGSGKTTRALELAENVKSKGQKVMGILSLRVLQGDETIGYMGVDLESGERFPLVILKTMIDSDDWRPIGEWKYAFSETGFRRANQVLSDAASKMTQDSVVFVDEFGHIELIGEGLASGVKQVVDSLVKGGKMVVLCRTDKIDAVLRFFEEKSAQVLVIEADRGDFLESLGDCFI